MPSIQGSFRRGRSQFFLHSPETYGDLFTPEIIEEIVVGYLWGGILMQLLAGLFVVLFLNPVFASDLNQPVSDQNQRCQVFLLSNISRPDTLPGVVVASPSKSSPDYYFHWVRDAALVMNQIVDLYLESPTTAEKDRYLKTLLDYVTLSRNEQLTPTLSGGPGEPKFYVDGRAYDGPWGRPQNDGPALRSITLMRLANHLLDLGNQEGNQDLVRRLLYESELPAHTVVKADLEFVAHHWQDASFDLWEEVKGDHFYTQLVQRRALIEGAKLAVRLGDSGAAQFYQSQVPGLEKAIQAHWDDSVGYFRATLNQVDGLKYKTSGLDVAILLASLHTSPQDPAADHFLSPANEQMLATLARLKDSFRGLYAINQNGRPGISIGRYPEDRYDGVMGTSGGNPWFLATNAVAEFEFRVLLSWKQQKSIQVSKTNLPFLISLGISESRLTPYVGKEITASGALYGEILEALSLDADSYVSRTLDHVDGSTGTMSEQFNRDSGFEQGAHDLTWSYASFMSLTRVRSRAHN